LLNVLKYLKLWFPSLLPTRHCEARSNLIPLGRYPKGSGYSLQVQWGFPLLSLTQFSHYFFLFIQHS